MVSEKQSEGFWHLAILIKKFPNKDSLFSCPEMKSFATCLRFSESDSKNIGLAKAGLALMEITPLVTK